MTLLKLYVGCTTMLLPFIILSTTMLYAVQKNLGANYRFNISRTLPSSKIPDFVDDKGELSSDADKIMENDIADNGVEQGLNAPDSGSNDGIKDITISNDDGSNEMEEIGTPGANIAAINSNVINDFLKEMEENKNLRSRETATKENVNIAWLMSYPKAGTTYTLSLYQAVSKTTAASNYGIERFESTGTSVIESNTHSSIPLLNNTSKHDPLNGPFRLAPDLPLPSTGYILTKTHCNGYCFDCPPNWYHYSPTKFLKGCVSGQYTSNNTIKWVDYNPTLVKKAIHIMRDPFDNIVSRYHHEIYRHSKSDYDDTNPSSSNYWDPQKFTPDIQGFRAWCDYQDSKWKFHYKKYWSEDIYNAALHVPCKKEFYQYVKWHNNAFEIIRAMGIDRIVIHYEDFAYNLEDTTRKMMNFLQHEDIDLQAKPEVRPILHYMEYYRPYMLKYVIQFLKELSSVETWFVLIRRYPYLGNAPPVPPELPVHI